MTDVLPALAEFLCNQPTAIKKLLAQHVDNGNGECRVCTLGGQRGRMRWPCAIFRGARMAADMLAR